MKHSPAVTAYWVSVKECIKAGGIIKRGTLLFDIATGQIYGMYDCHDNDEDVWVINTNVGWQGRMHRVMQNELMVNLLWISNLN